MCVSGGGEPEHVRVNIVNHELWPLQCDCRVCKKKPSAPIHMSIGKSCVTHTCAHTRFSTCSRDPGFLFFFSPLFFVAGRDATHAASLTCSCLADASLRTQWVDSPPGSQPSTVCLVPCARHACPVPSRPVHPIQPSGRRPPPTGPVSCRRSLPHRLSLPISSITLCGLHIYTSALFCLQKRFHYITKNNQ